MVPDREEFVKSYLLLMAIFCGRRQDKTNKQANNKTITFKISAFAPVFQSKRECVLPPSCYLWALTAAAKLKHGSPNNKDYFGPGFRNFLEPVFARRI
jgi:hypothetical protein